MSLFWIDEQFDSCRRYDASICSTLPKILIGCVPSTERSCTELHQNNIPPNHSLASYPMLCWLTPITSRPFATGEVNICEFSVLIDSHIACVAVWSHTSKLVAWTAFILWNRVTYHHNISTQKRHLTYFHWCHWMVTMNCLFRWVVAFRLICPNITLLHNHHGTSIQLFAPVYYTTISLSSYPVWQSSFLGHCSWFFKSFLSSACFEGRPSTTVFHLLQLAWNGRTSEYNLHLRVMQLQLPDGVGFSYTSRYPIEIILIPAVSSRSFKVVVGHYS